MQDHYKAHSVHEICSGNVTIICSWCFASVATATCKYTILAAWLMMFFFVPGFTSKPLYLVSIHGLSSVFWNRLGTTLSSFWYINTQAADTDSHLCKTLLNRDKFF